MFSPLSMASCLNCWCAARRRSFNCASMLPGVLPDCPSGVAQVTPAMRVAYSSISCARSFTGFEVSVGSAIRIRTPWWAFSLRRCWKSTRSEWDPTHSACPLTYMNLCLNSSNPQITVVWDIMEANTVTVTDATFATDGVPSMRLPETPGDVCLRAFISWSGKDVVCEVEFD